MGSSTARASARPAVCLRCLFGGSAHLTALTELPTAARPRLRAGCSQACTVLAALKHVLFHGTCCPCAACAMRCFALCNQCGARGGQRAAAAHKRPPSPPRSKKTSRNGWESGAAAPSQAATRPWQAARKGNERDAGRAKAMHCNGAQSAEQAVQNARRTAALAPPPGGGGG